MSQAEIRTLRRVIEQLSAAAAIIAGSGWKGGPAALVNVRQAYEGIAAIYNRLEPFLPRDEWIESPGKPQEAPDQGEAVPGAYPGAKAPQHEPEA